jgi:two-component system osmolarity sensor histidine kinase EnvZ
MGHWLSLFAVNAFKVLLPQSFRSRLMLLVLATVLAGQAATLYLVSIYQRNHAQTVALDLLATTIRTLQYSMEHVPPPERAEFVRQASQDQWRLWSNPLPNDARLQRRAPRNEQAATRTPQPRAGQAPHEEFSTDDVRLGLVRLIGRLNKRLSGDSRVALSRGPIPELYISLTRPNETELPRHREWLVIPLDRIDPPVATSLVIWWLSGLAVLLLLAAWFSWHITRSITRLVDATDRLAAGKPARVAPAGPAEIKRLGERFNAMLDALSQSEATRRTLLAGLPHDLKAPLSRMWLRIEMTDDLSLKDGMRKDLQDMQKMVDQFIQYLRGSDPATYHFATFAMNDWVTERVANWSGASNEVVMLGTPTSAMMSADSVALSRLLDNLISNALHHGAPPVEVSLSVVENWILLTVTDHGPGIAPERRAEAVKPFVRLDEARTRTGNVGLGLALVEAIALAHGGTLTLDQADDHGGLKVELRLPLAA